MNHYYTIDQINIGDKISYKDRYRSNKFPNWKVVCKLDQSLLLIEATELGSTEQRIIDITDVSELVIIPKD